MKRLFLPLFLVLAACGALPAAAGTIITATVIITNTAGTTDGETITVNSDTRTWKNSVVTPASQIQTTNSIGWAATNLFNHVSDSPFLNLGLGGLTNGITLQTLTVNGPLVVSVSSGWATVTLATNNLTSAIGVRVPLSVEYPTNQTNIATYLAQGLESSTYSVSQTAPFGSNWVNLGQAQAITGQKTLVQPVLTNALSYSQTNSNPISTNGVNYGVGFQSRGTSGGEQFGNGATTTANSGTAVGDGANSTGINAQAFGYSSQANGPSTTALGAFATSSGQNSTGLGEAATATADFATALGSQVFATGTNSLAAGQGAAASGFNSTAVGQGSSATFANSSAFGQGAAATATNQNMIGKAGQTVLAPGVFQAGSISNAVFSSTNNFPTGSDISYQRYALSTLANGNNAGVVVGTNIFCELSGPTGSFTVNGIAGGRDGKFIVLLNRTGQNMTIANDSGVDATAANRIYCLTGADKSVTGNSAAMLIYNANVSHWILLNFTQ